MNDNKKRHVRNYSAEFRVKAVHLVLDEKIPQVQVAKELGIPPHTLSGWLMKFKSGVWDLATGEPPVNLVTAVRQSKPYQSAAEDKLKIQELERQVRRLTLEREVLKKAVAYCVEVPK